MFELMAFITAFSALFFPVAFPCQIYAFSLSLITEQTSAKSRLIYDGFNIMSVSICTVFFKILSATVNESSKEMSIVGTHRMDYSKAKNILNIIEKYLKE
jgi:transcriptional regulator of heat shock response